MDRYEHCMIEFYWTHPSGVDPAAFKPSFTVFYPDGRVESHEGSNAALTKLLNGLGGEGWRVATGMTTSNWILYTLERKLA